MQVVRVITQCSSPSHESCAGPGIGPSMDFFTLKSQTAVTFTSFRTDSLHLASNSSSHLNYIIATGHRRVDMSMNQESQVSSGQFLLLSWLVTRQPFDKRISRLHSRRKKIREANHQIVPGADLKEQTALTLSSFSGWKKSWNG